MASLGAWVVSLGAWQEHPDTVVVGIAAGTGGVAAGSWMCCAGTCTHKATIASMNLNTMPPPSV